MWARSRRRRGSPHHHPRPAPSSSAPAAPSSSCQPPILTIAQRILLGEGARGGQTTRISICHMEDKRWPRTKTRAQSGTCMHAFVERRSEADRGARLTEERDWHRRADIAAAGRSLAVEQGARVTPETEPVRPPATGQLIIHLVWWSFSAYNWPRPHSCIMHQDPLTPRAGGTHRASRRPYGPHTPIHRRRHHPRTFLPPRGGGARPPRVLPGVRVRLQELLGRLRLQCST